MSVDDTKIPRPVCLQLRDAHLMVRLSEKTNINKTTAGPITKNAPFNNERDWEGKGGERITDGRTSKCMDEQD